MLGTLINVGTVLLGGVTGLLAGARLPEKVHQGIMSVLGLFTFAFGIQLFMKTQNPIIVLLALMLGLLIGEWARIESALESFGGWLERRVGITQEAQADPENGLDTQQRFVRGFVAASLLFCVGPMAILGSVQDGLTGNYQTLAIKSIMDGFAAMAFASSLGIGVLFSALSVFLYQGAITLAAAQIQGALSTAMMNEMTAAGGVMMCAIAVSSLLNIRPIRVGNLLPALLIAPLLVLLFQSLGIAA
jgi:uncharacterized membrane protein YqgA involved in biofilm formation